MSGLIWAGIGKGIADAGQTFGNYMAKDIEATRLEEREALREERLLKRQEALDQLKADREEAKAEALKQRVITESEAVGVKAAEIGAARDVAQGEKDVKGLINRQSQIAGDSPAVSEEEIKKLIAENPQYKEIYRAAGYIDKEPTANQKRLQRAEDESAAALQIGAHSSVIDAYSKKRKDVLEQIREENREKRDEQRHTETMTQQQRLSNQFNALLPIRQQQADASTTKAGAAVTSANRPRASGGGSGGSGGDSLDLRGLQTEATAASRAVTSARLLVAAQQKVVDNASSKTKAEANAALAEAKKKLDDAEAKAAQANSRISAFNTKRSGGATAPKTSDNAGTRPQLSSFVR